MLSSRLMSWFSGVAAIRRQDSYLISTHSILADFYIQLRVCFCLPPCVKDLVILEFYSLLAHASPILVSCCP